MPHQSALALKTEISDDPLDQARSLEILSWTDGLITSAAVGPQGVSTVEWMSLIWDCTDGEEADEWMKRPLETMWISWWRETVEIMRSNPFDYVPQFEGRGDELAAARIWADGFRWGMTLRPAAWRSLVADREHRKYLEPIILLYLDDDSVRKLLQPQAPWQPVRIEEVLEECAAEIVESVAGIYRYWHGRGAPVYPVGRNDPCPCGSGRKYKKCCRR